MFHNCFDGTLPKIQTFLTGQGVQGAQHRSPVLAELLPAMLDIYPPKNPAGSGAACAVSSPSCQQDRAKTKIFLSVYFISTWKAGIAQPSCTGVVPSQYGLLVLTWMGTPDPTVLPRPIPDPLSSEPSVLPPSRPGRGRDGQGWDRNEQKHDRDRQGWTGQDRDRTGSGRDSTHWPREVCTSSVMRVEVAGQTQFRASMAYLHSSSHTT